MIKKIKAKCINFNKVKYLCFQIVSGGGNGCGWVGGSYLCNKYAITEPYYIDCGKPGTGETHTSYILSIHAVI